MEFGLTTKPISFPGPPRSLLPPHHEGGPEVGRDRRQPPLSNPPGHSRGKQRRSAQSPTRPPSPPHSQLYPPLDCTDSSGSSLNPNTQPQPQPRSRKVSPDSHPALLPQKSLPLPQELNFAAYKRFTPLAPLTTPSRIPSSQHRRAPHRWLPGWTGSIPGEEVIASEPSPPSFHH